MTSVLAISLVIAACGAPNGSDEDSTQSNDQIVLELDGYPLDRTLKGMSEWGLLEAAVIVDNITVVEVAWTTADRKPPAFILERRQPTEAEGAVPPTIVTKYTATVVESLSGKYAVGQTVTFFAAGGTVDNVTVAASAEVAPPTRSLTGQTALIAGTIETLGSDAGISVAFAYKVDGQRVESVMVSGSNDAPDFTITEARSAFQK